MIEAINTGAGDLAGVVATTKVHSRLGKREALKRCGVTGDKRTALLSE